MSIGARFWSLALFVAIGAAAPGALAAPLGAEQILNQFNLVVFDDLDAGSDVEGRTYVGRDLKGNSATFYTRPNQVAASAYAALLVGDDVEGGWKNVNGSGDAYVGDDVVRMNMNGGKAYIGGSISGTVNGSKQTGATVAIPTYFEATLNALSAQLVSAEADSTIGFANASPNRKATFDAAPGADGVAVFDIADGAAFFSSIGEIAFNPNGAEAIVINVGGRDLDIAENFLGGVGAQIAAITVWNFYEAVSLDIEREFFGTVLAPIATLRNTSAINGSVVAQAMTQRGAVRLPSFAANLPLSFADADGGSSSAVAATEPPVGLALLAGAAVFVAWRRRRA